jgi:hypothetical protein
MVALLSVATMMMQTLAQSRPRRALSLRRNWYMSRTRPTCIDRLVLLGDDALVVAASFHLEIMLKTFLFLEGTFLPALPARFFHPAWRMALTLFESLRCFSPDLL